MSRGPSTTSKRFGAFVYLNDNHGSLAPSEMSTTIAKELDIPLPTAKVYVSQWRKNRGEAKVYAPRSVRKESVATVPAGDIFDDWKDEELK